MSGETNKKIVRRLLEDGIKPQDYAALEQCVDAGVVDHTVPPGLAPGREAMKPLLAMFVSAFPDFRCRIEDLVADGDQVAARVTWSGTHRGAFMGVPPTSRHVSFSGITFYRLASDKIVELWDNSDNLGLMQQLTQVSDPAAAV